MQKISNLHFGWLCVSGMCTYIVCKTIANNTSNRVKVPPHRWPEATLDLIQSYQDPGVQLPFQVQAVQWSLMREATPSFQPCLRPLTDPSLGRVPHNLLPVPCLQGCGLPSRPPSHFLPSSSWEMAGLSGVPHLPESLEPCGPTKELLCETWTSLLKRYHCSLGICEKSTTMRQHDNSRGNYRR